MKPVEAPIVGPRVRDQATLRRRQPVRDLSEFLEFLARMEGIFGPIERRRLPTTGDRFLL